MKKNSVRYGRSYIQRVIEVNEIYDSHARSGLSNREIWRRHIYPKYGISEKTFYNYINASARIEEMERERLQEVVINSERQI